MSAGVSCGGEPAMHQLRRAADEKRNKLLKQRANARIGNKERSRK